MSHKGSSCGNQVRTSRVQIIVNKEIFLLPSEVHLNFGHIGIKQLAYRNCSLANRLERFLKRCLVVERLTRIGDEHRGDTETIIEDEYRRRGVPGRVSTGLESSTDSTRWETRRIGFLLHEVLAFEGLNHSSFTIVFHKRVMLLGRRFGQRLEPMAAMCHPMLHCPLFHTCSHPIGHFKVKGLAIIDTIQKGMEGLGIQILLHLLSIEDQFTEIFRRTAFGDRILGSTFLECCFDSIKSQFAHIILYFYFLILKRHPYCKINLVECRIIYNLAVEGNAE